MTYYYLTLFKRICNSRRRRQFFWGIGPRGFCFAQSSHAWKRAPLDPTRTTAATPPSTVSLIRAEVSALRGEATSGPRCGFPLTHARIRVVGGRSEPAHDTEAGFT